jgi:RecA-family ATPase
MPLAYIKADALDSMQIEKPFFVVEKILPIGLGVLASPPKYGKSWLGLDLCISVATGTKFLGFDTNRSDVLYLALEDSNARLQERMRKVLNGRKAPTGLGYAIRAGTLQHGLIEQLEKYIEENPNVKLIVIDTFQMIRGESKKGQSAYAADYSDCSQLKTFADSKKICLLIVHHMRKMRDVSDTFANISGTAGISGAADTMITMSKENRDDENTKLSITGRDVEMQDYQIQFNKNTCRWQMLGASNEVEELQAIREYDNSPIVLTIKKLLEQNREGWTGSATELIDASMFYNTPIRDDSRKLGKSIGKYQDLLYRQDNIIYKAISNGSGAKKHSFYYGHNPFEDE